MGTGWSVESAFTKYGAYSFCVRDKKDEKAAIQFADGLVFTGGGDIEPSRYGEHRWHPDVYGVSKKRDDQEFRMAALARKRGIPMFGICRGLQLLNVAHGGTLHQDIDQYDATHLHHYGGQHDIFLREGTGVQKHLNTLQVKGTSLHHQAIDRMGEGLLPAGASIDGLVEMIESAEGVWPYILATQFHPEMDHKDKDNEAAGGIFQHFVNVCALKAGRRKPLDIRKTALHKARGLGGNSSYGNGTGYVYHGGSTHTPSTTTIDDWRGREACPHGYKYHCTTNPDGCQFGDKGYTKPIQTGFVAPSKGSEDNIDAILDNIPSQDGWVWSHSLEAWVPRDYDDDSNDDENYREWLLMQARWNERVRELNEDTPRTDLAKYAEYDDYDGWC
jgi:putative glutamine amidotransferase